MQLATSEKRLAAAEAWSSLPKKSQDFLLCGAPHNRKNWLFVGSKDGAEWNATIVSLIASCALHGIEPWAYLRDVLILLPTWPPDRVIELAPKSWKQTLENADTRERLAASPWPRAPDAAPS
ncbi:transposase domain-containing protein [Sorangium sp. So ce367]|uniref:transposase domain-containing protein n=1 Tax=Sorangium sp. So ce367 TaxID=3133305 RepID=UPI003F5F3B1C